MSSRCAVRRVNAAEGRRSGLRAALRVLALTLIVAACLTAPAWADTGLAHSDRLDALVLLILASGGAATIARRRAAALSLALLLALFGVESAVHSVHHLGDSQSAESCAFSSSSQHAAGTCPANPETGVPLPVSEPSLRIDQAALGLLAVLPTYEGRAPPVRPAA
jgi:hypothetical protein